VSAITRDFPAFMLNDSMRRVCVLLLMLAAASAAPAQMDFVPADLRAGEPVDGFPNWSERVLHEWINRARVDPQADLAKCGAACVEKACYGPVIPLGWGEALNRAARYHANEMVKQKYFGHDSKCTIVSNIYKLYPAGCNGSASCGCVGGSSTCGSAGCTPWTSRIMLFGTAPGGEIITSSADPNQAFYLWLYETAANAVCGYSAANGHRYLILQASGSVGLGVDRYSVGDFGVGDPPYRIPSGSHYPRQAPSVELWANWYDSKAPKGASAVVDGKCVTMSLKRGSATNGAWSATANNVGSGCHRYYFSFKDSSGAEVTYPQTGSLGIGSGASCPDWVSSRLHSNCGVPVTPPPVPGRRRSVRH
jgi:hypothetical protein